MFSLTQLFAIGITYLIILFGSAYATEKGFIPHVIAKHPAIRVLSLGVFAGAIAFYGAVGFSAQYGSGYLLYFLGSSAAFFITPVLLAPISRIAQAHKLGSLADVFAFRYPAPWVGGIISLLMLFGVLPLLALQIQAVSVTVHLLNQELSEDVLAIVFCLTMIVFAILFGARHLSTRNKHEGLVVAIGLGSILKLAALVILAWYCVSQIFGSPDAMQIWLNDNQELLAASEKHLGDGASRSLLLTFFAAAVAMPHVYHMLITENDDERALSGARWGFPLYMLLFSLCIPPILWAAKKIAADTPAEFFPIAIGLVTGNQGITILAFIACLAAASGVLIVTTLALASMTLNHILLPLYRPSSGVDIYSLLLNTRRGLIATIILGSFGIYQLLGEGQSLMSLGIVAFVAVSQFLPGLVGGFHWQQSNRTGLIAGLITGHLVWFSYLLLPLIYAMLVDIPFSLEVSDKSWQAAATMSLGSNTLMFVFFSALSRPTAEETLAAQECTSDSLSGAFRGVLQARSVPEIENNLATALGRAASSREVNLALSELSFLEDEHRPHALSQLRVQMETNLSSMLGQTIAHRIIGRVLPFKSTSSSVHVLESYLEDYRSQLTGLAAELDDLRRYHRQVLQDLPTAVCSIDNGHVIRTWNHAMQEVTGIETGSIVGFPITSLTEPWKELLNTFIYDNSTHRLKIELQVSERSRLVNLHKASISNYPQESGDLVIVIEDLTESQLIEEQLIHSERLASIGQFAAGIAHEIGNPVTGIACLAQNLKIDTDQPDLIELSSNILEQTERISNILQSLVNFAYGSKGDMKRPSVPVELRLCINESIKLLSLNQSEHEVMFTNMCLEDVFILGDPQRLSQVFVNLLSNAQDASRELSEIQIISRLEDEVVAIDIIDQGHGVPSNQLKRIFEPFFTTKDPGEGTGLGLAIVTTIVEEHHGSIIAESAGESGGTRVTIRLPQYFQGDSLRQDYATELTSPSKSLLSS
jgi:PAS domain S-box-containing protein